jgi:hypothetical protein
MKEVMNRPEVREKISGENNVAKRLEVREKISKARKLMKGKKRGPYKKHKLFFV